MNISTMQDAAGRASDLMKALASETRLLLLCQMAEEERSVGALADLLGLRQAAVSQQLALLRKDGLVDSRRAGQTIYYRIASDEARRIIQLLYDMFCAAAEQPGKRRAKR